jgi:tetratricopeptide (TPR) repeat protein
MGTLLNAMGKSAEAEPYFREALEGYRRALGDDHPATLRSINNMGYLLDSMRKPAEAEPLYLEAYRGWIARRAESPLKYDPQVKVTVERLTNLYDAWDKPEEAQKWREELEKIEVEFAEAAGNSGTEELTTADDINP